MNDIAKGKAAGAAVDELTPEVLAYIRLHHLYSS